MDNTLISNLLKAVFMGIVEGLTEFLPISSTGHLIIAGRLLQFPERIADTFEIFIQLGAVLAVVVYFSKDLLQLLQRAVKEPSARMLLINIGIAFIPAAVVGVLFRSLIKEYLFGPITVALALIVGGIIMLFVEMRPRPSKVTTLETIRQTQAFGIGIAQIASLWSGFSRSAATLVGGLLMGLDRATALRFSFYLAIPTLGIATLYDLYKSRAGLLSSDVPIFGVGLVVSFVVALVVIRLFLSYVSRRTLIPFAWYRIIVGVIVLLWFR